MRYDQLMTTLLQTQFTLWEQALLTRDPSTVADLYTDGGTLLPTMGNQVLTNRQGIEGYFEHFLSLNPVVEILEEHVHPATDDCYLHCGHYRFTIEQDGQSQIVDARFSMEWEKQGDDWKIVHHHSSRLPEVASA